MKNELNEKELNEKIEDLLKNGYYHYELNDYNICSDEECETYAFIFDGNDSMWNAHEYIELLKDGSIRETYDPNY